MSDADNVSAVLRLSCPNGHEVGRLFMQRGQPWIEYKSARKFDPPELWPVGKDDLYSERVCPGGCQYEVGAPADHLVQRVIALTNDSATDQDTFTLTFIGPPRIE